MYGLQAPNFKKFLSVVAAMHLPFSCKAVWNKNINKSKLCYKLWLLFINIYTNCAVNTLKYILSSLCPNLEIWRLPSLKSKYHRLKSAADLSVHYNFQTTLHFLPSPAEWYQMLNAFWPGYRLQLISVHYRASKFPSFLVCCWCKVQPCKTKNWPKLNGVVLDKQTKLKTCLLKAENLPVTV